MHRDTTATHTLRSSGQTPQSLGCALLVTSALTLSLAGCAPPATPDAPYRPGTTSTTVAPRVTEAFPEGTAQSAVKYWHDNPDLMPRALEGSTLLLDAAGAGASSVPLPAEHAHEPLVVVLTCARPAAFSISLVSHDSDDAPPPTGGTSCGGPHITIVATPRLSLSSTDAAIHVDVPSGTAYYLAIYRHAIGNSTY